MSEQQKKTRRKLDEEAIKFLILHNLKKYGGNIAKTSRVLRVCRKTIYDWMKKDPDFNHEVQIILERMR